MAEFSGSNTISGELTEESVDQPLWFCVQTHPKHEHIAAATLEKVAGFEVFNPRIRMRRATQRGPVWFTESAFSGYIFARFDLQLDLLTVRHSASVSKVVHFDSGYPSIPEKQMQELRATFGDGGTVELSPGLAPGDKVRIAGGAFHDLLAVVHQVLPMRGRVQALLEFLGRMTTVELDLRSVVAEDRSRAFGGSLNRPASVR